MTKDEAVKTLHALLNGKHPETGEALDARELCRAELVREALGLAIEALEGQERKAAKAKKPKSSREWTAEEETMLRRMTELHLSDEVIAALLMRTVRAVRNRIENSDNTLRNSNLPWSEEDDALLRSAWTSRPVEELAKELQRTGWALCCRAELLGLVPKGTYMREK